MNRLIPALAISTLLAASGGAVAQSKDYHQGFKHSGHMGLHRIEKVVELTDEQKTALNELRQTMQAERPDRLHIRLYDLDPTAADYQEQVNERADAAAEQARQRVLRHGEMHKRVQAILTDEQKVELKAHHQEMLDRPGRRNKMIEGN